MPNSWADVASDMIANGQVADDAPLRDELDGIARLAARILGARIALVSLMTQSSQLFVGSVGLESSQVPREGSFCSYALYQAKCTSVGDAQCDPRFAEHPMVAGAPFIRFFAGLPLVSDGGAPVGSLCVMDMAPHAPLSQDDLDSLQTLATAAMACLERWRATRDCGEKQQLTLRELDGVSPHFQTLADALPQLVWSTPPDGLSDYFNRQWCQFTGAPPTESYATGWMDFLHPDDVHNARSAWLRAVDTAHPYTIEYRLRRADGTYRWMLTRGLPVLDDAGAVTRWIGTCTDIDERVRTGETMELLSQELNHRIKNLFAVVQGLISMASRKYAGGAAVGQALQARMVALGRAHDLVWPRISGGTIWRSQTTLKQLVEILLAPYLQDDVSRLEIVGDDVAVNEHVATPLALFFHELATNSARFGALSSPQGRVRLEIAMGDDIAVNWQESGGPPIDATPTPAFGMNLAQISVERQLGGSLTLNWHAEGLHAQGLIPLRQLIRD